MIKLSVFYPNAADAAFDVEYYRDTHMPMVKKRLGSALKRVSIDKGLAGAEPGSPAAYVAIGHLYFDSIDDFHRAFVPHMAEIVADVPNFTNTRPSAQLSDVAL